MKKKKNEIGKHVHFVPTQTHITLLLQFWTHKYEFPRWTWAWLIAVLICEWRLVCDCVFYKPAVGCERETHVFLSVSSFVLNCGCNSIFPALWPWEVVHRRALLPLLTHTNQIGLTSQHPKTLNEVFNITNTCKNMFELHSLITVTTILEGKRPCRCPRTSVHPPSSIKYIKRALFFYVFAIFMHL